MSVFGGQVAHLCVVVIAFRDLKKTNPTAPGFHWFMRFRHLVLV